MFRYERWNLLFMGLIFSVTTVYAVFAIFQWNTMRSQLAMTDRPWIKVKITPVTPLTFSKDNSEVKITIRTALQNVGRSVATKVRFDSELYINPLVSGNPIFDPIKHHKTILDKITSQQIGPVEEGSSIFPGDENGYSKELSTTIKQSDLLHFENLPNASFIYLYVMGWVDYQYESSPNQHQTGFIYRLYCTIPSPIGTIKVGEDVPVESLQPKADVWGGQYAN